MKMNKKLLMLGATFVLTAQIGTNAMAEATTGSADVEVVTPLAISQTSGLNFGTIAVGSIGGGGIGGDVTVSVAGAISTGAAAADLKIIGGSPSAGTFAITGLGIQAITVSVATSVTLSGGGGADMTAALVHDNPVALAAGAATLNVGGTLTAAAGQGAGTYTGNYAVTVVYQ